MPCRGWNGAGGDWVSPEWGGNGVGRKTGQALEGSGFDSGVHQILTSFPDLILFHRTSPSGPMAGG